MVRRAILFGFVLSLVSCAPKDSSTPPLATVNGAAISAEDFHRYLEKKPSARVLAPDGRTVQVARISGNLGYQALQDLVARRILLDLAKQRGVLPTKDDVAAEIAFQSKSDPDFVSRLNEQGMSTSEIEDDVLLDLAQERLITEGVSISDKAVSEYIQSNPQEFEIPAQASLLWIVLDRPELKSKVDAELSGGQNFRLVARKYSIAPGVGENDGEFPERRLDRLPATVRKRIEATKELETTEWFLDGKRWVKLYVENKVAPRKVEIDDTVRQKVKRALALKRGQENRDLRAMLEEATRQAKVEIVRPEFASQWAKEHSR